MKILFSTVRVKLEQDGITRRSDVSVNSLSLADDAELLSLLSSTGAAGLWDPRTDALIPELERSTVRSISTWDATAEADLCSDDPSADTPSDSLETAESSMSFPRRHASRGSSRTTLRVYSAVHGFAGDATLALES